MVFCMGFQNVKVKGKRATSRDAPVICVAPHSSFFDVFIMFYCSGVPSSLSRAENSKMFLVSGTYTLSIVSNNGHFLMKYK